MQFYRCEFEVFGKVQNVFFRKYTQKQAISLHLTGWCMNTKQNTVIGELEGDETKINEMKIWLENTGSPYSIISKATFSPLIPSEIQMYKTFTIKK